MLGHARRCLLSANEGNLEAMLSIRRWFESELQSTKTDRRCRRRLATSPVTMPNLTPAEMTSLYRHNLRK